MTRGGSRFCKGCEYDLTGIEAGKCPECAREFDPADRRTWHARPRRRLIRLVRRILIAVAAVLLIAALLPRGYGVARLTIRTAGTTPTSLRRFELIPPRWLDQLSGGIRYPYWTSQVPDDAGHATGRSFAIDARIRVFTFRGTINASSRSSGSSSNGRGTSSVNKVVISPENADEVLDVAIRRLLPGGPAGVGSMPGARAPAPAPPPQE